jgi:hypothetical protein
MKFDFSHAATRKAVWNESISHPFTLYPVGVGVLGCLAMGLFGISTIALTASLGGLFLGLGSLFINSQLRSDVIAQGYVSKLQREMDKERKVAMRDLLNDLEDLERNRVFRTYADQAGKQYEHLEERFSTFKDLISRRFSSQELSYARYMATVEQLNLLVVHNLQRIASILRSISAINMDYIQSRLDALAALQSPSSADEKEWQTLQERKALFQEQLERVNEILSDNEAALTQMDKINTSFARLDTDRSGSVGITLEETMKDLEKLAVRIGHYES